MTKVRTTQRKPKAPAGSATVRASNGRLQLTILINGKRKYLSLGLSESKRNWDYANMVASVINNDRLTSNFDKTLEVYKTKYCAKFEPEPAEEVRDLTIADVWEKYTNYKRPQLSPSTIAKDFNHVSSYIEKFAYTSLADAVAVRNWMVENSPPITSRRVIRQLSAACKWAVESNYISVNPFLGMAQDLKVSRRDADETDIQTFTADERDRIIDYLNSINSEYAGLIEFMFRTGCRPGEVTALQWGDIDRDFKTITFERTLVLSDDGLVIKQGLKTQQRRVFPCGEGLQTFLKSIAPEEIDRGRLVFTPPKAKYVDMHNFSSKKWKPILIAAGVDYRKLYSIRHTYITFCIDGGMDAKDVAKLVGNSPEIIYRHYAGAKRNLVAPGF
jgi:integrase